MCADELLLAQLFARNADAETARYFHPFALTEQSASQLACNKGRDRYYVAVRGGKLIGLSMLRGWDEGYTIPSFGILIDRDSQSQGIGSRLLHFTMSDARRIGVTRVRLSVYASHVSALRLYIIQGFVEQSRSRVETDFGEDYVIAMVKDLECEEASASEEHNQRA
jgi:ribosomal-protein-alanine N-acetyltransferase